MHEHTTPTREHILGIALTTLLLLVAAIMLALYAAAALGWAARPFPGFLMSRDLVVATEDPLTSADAWPARAAGLAPGDRVVALDGVALDTLTPAQRLDTFNDILSDHEPGDTVTLRYWHDGPYLSGPPTGAACDALPDRSGTLACTITISLREVPAGDLLGFWGVGALSGLVMWIIGLAVFVVYPRHLTLRLVAALAAALAIVAAGRFDMLTTHLYPWVWLPAGALAGALAVTFALIFPFDLPVTVRYPALRWAPIVAGLALSAAALGLYRSGDIATNRSALTLTEIVLAAGLIALGAILFWRRERAYSPVVRNRTSIVLLGLVPALLPLLVRYGWWAIAGEPLTGVLPFVYGLLVLLPLSMVYAGVQARLVDTDRLISQSTLYGVLLVILVLGYWLVTAGIAVLIGRSAQDTRFSPLMITAAIFAVALLILPLRTAVQNLIDRTYFRTRRAYQARLEAFTHEITNAVTLRDVLRLLKTYLADAVAPTHLILFVRDLETGVYLPERDPDRGDRPTDIVFASDSGLVRYLRGGAELLHLEEGRPLPLDVVSDRARLAVLGAPVVLGLRGQQALSGFLLIGPRRGGIAYLQEDLRFIESLGDQVALAVERSQAVEDLARKARVQDVLSQVSRALNFAIDFDTLLELVYAQTIRVIDAPNFYIALRDPNTDELYYVFYNEGDERIAEMEGKRWRIGLDLMSEIARTQQTIRTEDYVRASMARDPDGQLDNPYLRAWMGVPLMADTGGVLGVMVAATTDPTVQFNDEQQDLFWDIANLASSAIDKLQLFNKTQQRARQLNAINEIASQLASELGNVDRLLQLITENAVQILGAEAGSLMLVDEETSELQFRVVVGGRSSQLIGRRLPAGTGLAGATVQRGKSIIVNDPSRDSRWYGDIAATEAEARATLSEEDDYTTDDDHSFQSRAILSVPLMVHGRAIGVLQTINKQDGSIFVKEDADLLETFAGQAAIAIENARLFDMTDQQLALRVQELDTMQRIDQELNRTLNLERVIDITMDWALRKSGASAGALFILDPESEHLRVVATYGYEPGSLYGAIGAQVAADRGVLGRVVHSAQPSLITEVGRGPGYQETLPGCVAQLVVPLFSANQVIGIIILESQFEGELDLLDLDFVARLAEHASPAIVNARLFSELEQANESKSEFVSFVAHELKNPMTSMKGYTDLLLKGVVGPVNQQQADFLNTIYNNVNRMETLVSDLNDLTKQQTNNLRLETAPIDFGAIVEETLRAQQRQIEEREQVVDLDIPDDLPLVMADRNRLFQVMTNFVSNAHKYTPEGGSITIRAAATRNHWDPQGPPDVIHCQVADTGVGMSADELEQLFTPYFRSENPKVREQPGTGLGLTITRGLIELHGGRIWVESTPDVGTTFHFTIPVAMEKPYEKSRVGPDG